MTVVTDLDVAPADETDDATVVAGEPGLPSDASDREVRGQRWARLCVYGLLPALVIGLAGGSGYVKWRNEVVRQATVAQVDAVAAASDGAAAMLSYQPATASAQLGAARDRLTGRFRDSYDALIRDVVIPGATQKQISATATVAGSGLVTANSTHAVVLVFVNQSISEGTDAPSNTASSVRVTLDKIGDRWLISDFTPI